MTHTDQLQLEAYANSTMLSGDRYVALFGECDKALADKFYEFHQANPAIYHAFKRFSYEAKASGRKRFSHWAVAQRIRWYTMIETTGSDYKLSNDFIALYARLLVFEHPEFTGFFTFKKMKSDRKS
jgi:hypothetical protein